MHLWYWSRKYQLDRHDGDDYAKLDTVLYGLNDAPSPLIRVVRWMHSGIAVTVPGQFTAEHNEESYTKRADYFPLWRAVTKWAAGRTGRDLQQEADLESGQTQLS